MKIKVSKHNSCCFFYGNVLSLTMAKKALKRILALSLSSNFSTHFIVKHINIDSAQAFLLEVLNTFLVNTMLQFQAQQLPATEKTIR